jgi:hypothetical protein
MLPVLLTDMNISMAHITIVCTHLAGRATGGFRPVAQPATGASGVRKEMSQETERSNTAGTMYLGRQGFYGRMN